jgi:Xaa-Pro aminopeptidase
MTRARVDPHLERTVAGMVDADVDVLLLGREANARYVSGADRLWLAGTRAFAPGCVVVRETATVHLLSITDDGIPGDDARDRLYPMSWNPMTIVGAVAALPGVGEAKRIGVDGITPMFEQLLDVVLPAATLVDGEALLRAVRRAKSTDDVDAIRAACRVAADALAAVEQALAPGVSELALQSAFERRMTAHGSTAPAFEPTCCVVDRGARPRAFATDRTVRDGDRVQIRAGVMLDGWEGLATATLVCGGQVQRSPGADTAIAACRSGAGVGELRSSGVVVEGTGMGHEELDDAETLEPGMVLALEVTDGDVTVGAVVHVTNGPPELLAPP